MKAPKRPLLRYFGGKWILANWIISHFPAHTIYTEAFGGGASVLLRKERSYAEIYNDLDQEIVNLFKVARESGEELCDQLRLTPYSRDEFELSYQGSDCPIEQARRTLVRSYMGHGSTMTRLTVGGRLMRTGFRTYSKKNRRSIPAHDWKTYPDSLPAIENTQACKILQTHDSDQTLHYLDPTYLHSTRGRCDGYRHEMKDAEHVELLQFVRQLKGKVALSGYDCGLYRRHLADWNRFERESMADGARERIEVLWVNY